MQETCAIIPAAGRGLRMGKDRPKQFLELSGKSILLHTIETFSEARFLSHIFLVAPEDFIPEARRLLEAHCERAPRRFIFEDNGAPAQASSNGAPITFCIVPGGAERQDSVFNALEHLPAGCRWVMIHDGVRPFASLELIEKTWETAVQKGAAIAALPATDTVKRVTGEQVAETLPREEIWLVQTPQVFRKDIILEAYRAARDHGWRGTDDASLVERLDIPVAVVHGERTNIKVTTPEDLGWAEWLLAQRTVPPR